MCWTCTQYMGNYEDRPDPYGSGLSYEFGSRWIRFSTAAEASVRVLHPFLRFVHVTASLAKRLLRSGLPELHSWL